MNPKFEENCWEEISPALLPSSFSLSENRSSVPCFDYRLAYGANPMENGTQFQLFSRSATSVRLLLYADVRDTEPSDTISLSPETNRWGDVWSLFVPHLKPGALYHYQVDGPFVPEKGLRFQKHARLVDPYAKALAGDYLFNREGVLVPPKCVVVSDAFDWKGDRHLRYPLADTVIYELHVRGLTQSPTSGCQAPGTYRGVTEKIPYLKSLGVSAVELMPVHEFLVKDPYAPEGTQPRTNYWGYNTLAFFAPHHDYAQNQAPGAVVKEFKEMVLALHQAGIEVILDVVFNHTAEGNELGPTLSFKGLENPVYYMLEDNAPQYYKNYSGCGNTVNGNHPIVRELIFNCLRYWVHNYHIDGFRFDLASILSRDRNGHLTTNTPVVETIAEDPLLADTKIIAEAWDAAGAYQVGHFSSIRWAEWNGRYRDDVRRYWRNDSFMTSLLATRIAGSSDLYKPGGRAPYHSINFVTSHDGFTLNDLFSYNGKHNEANGEDNHDGDNNNFSYNYGVEGPTDNPFIDAIRLRQIKNTLATLLFSQGVPMLLMGDECRRTQGGNNNAYCQDNAISWMDWTLTRKHAELLRFFRALVEFRRAEPTLRHANFLSGHPATDRCEFPDVAWFRHDGQPFNWNDSCAMLVCMLSAVPDSLKVSPRPDFDPFLWKRMQKTEEKKLNDDVLAQPHYPPLRAMEGEFRRSNHLLFLFNSEDRMIDFHFPVAVRHLPWRLFINTANAWPNDIFPELDGPRANVNIAIRIPPRSFRCYQTPGTGEVFPKAP
ncbi:MAG: glycogen debranching protein GlgX [Planctomycetia bacterium]|nr:glycogen debranching protein GlgX [Planctomycetia bacterium]